MGAIRRRVVSIFAISLSLCVWTHAEGATESPLRLDVYDYVGIAPDVRMAAAEVTRHVYAAIGVDIAWVDRCPVACHIAFSREAETDTTRGNLMVTILPAAMTSRGFPTAAMGAAPEEGHVAYAFFDRIRSAAFFRDVSLATMLGHVIAHEAGHILLREGHAHVGLMRAEWVDGDLLQAKLGRFGFTAKQGRRIRSRLGVVQDLPVKREENLTPIARRSAGALRRHSIACWTRGDAG